jgi:signal transduction histidine kinase
MTRHPQPIHATVRRVPATPAGFAEVQTAELRRTFRALLRVRLAAFPIFVLAMLWYWRATGGSRAQLAVIGAFVVVAAAQLAWLFHRDQRALGARSIEAGFILTIVLVYVAGALSGGLDSPFVILVPAVAAAGAFGTDRSHWWIVAAILPAGIGLLALVGGSKPLFTIGVLLFGSIVGISVGITIRRMFDRLLVRALQARDDLLRMHAEQLQSLTAFSSEIAHELKTPLASIKGLTGLALMELSEPARAAERLAVLRNEALRMQRMLDEFVDFSRPLVPLVVDPANPLRIAEEVLDLFQGLARERQLAISLSGAPGELHCDARKVKQILINLVQNAVEASPPGREIAVEVEPGPLDVTLRVSDRGHGLSGDLGDRVFEAGVTTKARGSGLGLTIARSMAKQHGGTLSLRTREGGGCVAELVLPRGAAVESHAGQAA